MGQKGGYLRVFPNKSWNNLQPPPVTKRVTLVSIDQIDLDGWSPLEIFPPVPILENSPVDPFHHQLTPPPFHRARGESQTEQEVNHNRATGVQLPCNIGVPLG